jgi:hypothetical protein
MTAGVISPALLPIQQACTSMFVQECRMFTNYEISGMECQNLLFYPPTSYDIVAVEFDHKFQPLYCIHSYTSYTFLLT